MSEKMGIMKLTYRGLKVALDLPEGVEVVDVLEDESWKRSNTAKPNAFEIVLKGEGLPVVPEGSLIPYVTAVWDRNKGSVSFG